MRSEVSLLLGFIIWGIINRCHRKNVILFELFYKFQALLILNKPNSSKYQFQGFVVPNSVLTVVAAAVFFCLSLIK